MDGRWVRIGGMLWVLTAHLALAQSPQTPVAVDVITRMANRMADQLVRIRRHLHMYPELSNREFRTAAYIAERLRAIGLDEVRTGIARTGVVGILRGNRPGPVIAVRADMDALPVEETIDVPYKSRHAGVKHACGHDAHMTVALGTAMVLTAWKRAGHPLPGTVVFIFQPAEEGPPPGEEGGASLMVREGVLDDPPVEAIFGLHVSPLLPVGTVGFARGPILAAASRFEIRIHGKQTHGAYPHLGVDPIYIGALIVTALQSIVSRSLDPREAAVVSVGIFQAGNRFNIIPEEARLVGTIRTLNDEVHRQVVERIRNIVDRITSAYGATYEFHTSLTIPVTRNDPDLVNAVLPAIQAALGSDRVQEVMPQMGAEDFAFYAQKIPGFYFWLGVWNPENPEIHMLHTPKFDIDERALPIGVRAMSSVVLHYLWTHAEK